MTLQAHRITALRCGLAVLALALPALALAADGLPEPRQVSAHAWAWIGPYGPPTKENGGYRMNLGFVVGADGVAVIDSGYGDPMAKAMLERIREVSDKPVRYVVSTDTRPHRVLGNEVFRESGAQVVMTPEAAVFTQAQGGGMARTAEEILGLSAGSIRSPGAPDVSLTQAVSLDLGDVTLNVIPVGAAHTPGQLIVEVVEDNVVFAGDVLYRGRLLSVLSESRVDEWIDAYGMLRELDDALFVPGHGEPGRLEEFEHPTHEYLTLLKSHMDEAVDRGVGLQDAIESLDQSAWQGLADFDPLAGRNAHRTYLEREAAAFE